MNRLIGISNRYLVAHFDPQTGAWGSLQSSDDGRSLLRRGDLPFDLIVDGKPIFGDESHRPSSVRAVADGHGLEFVYEIAGLCIMHQVELDEQAPVMRQSVRIQVVSGPARKLTAVHYTLPGLVVGSAEDCLLQAPGQFIPPDTPYEELARVPLDTSVDGPRMRYVQGWLEPAPCHSPGLVVLENKVEQQVVSAWLYSEVAPTFATVDGDGTLITVGHRHQLAAWLKPGVELSSEGHCLLLTRSSLSRHLQIFRHRAYGDRLTCVDNSPDWFSDVRLLQIGAPLQVDAPAHFRPAQTVAEWRPRLDEVRDLGFNLIQMMPVWAYEDNCYCLSDHYQIDPRVATPEELIAFVAAAHERGIRVIFDLIPQGISVRSPFIKTHADWMVRDELGRYYASHGWGPKAGEPADMGTYSVDWGHPEYRQYIVDWAVWNVQTFGIDGYRTDALSWKEPNFDPGNPRPAWQTMYGGVRIGEALRTALKRVKPDAILLSELWGPVFQRSHDASYCNHWLVGFISEGWLKDEPLMTGAQWARYLELEAAASPTGTWRARYSANHDWWRIAPLARQSPLGDTVSFVHAFSDGFPFVWCAELEGRELFFKSLMHQRRQLAGYHCDHGAAHAESPTVFTSLWSRDGQGCILALANLSRKAVQSSLLLEVPVARPQQVFGSGEVQASIAGGRLTVELPAAAYALIRL